MNPTIHFFGYPHGYGNPHLQWGRPLKTRLQAWGFDHEIFMGMEVTEEFTGASDRE